MLAAAKYIGAGLACSGLIGAGGKFKSAMCILISLTFKCYKDYYTINYMLESILLNAFNNKEKYLVISIQLAVFKCNTQRLYVK